MFWLYLFIILQLFWTHLHPQKKSGNIIVNILPNHDTNKHVKLSYHHAELLAIRDGLTTTSISNRVPYGCIRRVREL